LLLVLLLVARGTAAAAPRIGVLTVKVSGGLDEGLSGTAVDAVATAIADLRIGTVVTGEELRGLVDASTLPQALACSDAPCLIEIGGAAGLDRMVAGELTRADDAFIVRLRVVDVRAAKVDNSVTLTWRGEVGAFLDLLDVGARQLLVPADSLPFGRVSVQGAPPGFWWTANGRRIDVAEAELVTGVYDVTVEAAGYAPVQRSIIVRPGQTTALDGNLTRDRNGTVSAVVEKTSAAEKPAFETRSGVAIQGDAVLPLTGYATDQTGFGGSISYWNQLAFIALQPRFGVQYASGPGGASYLSVVADFGIFWVPLAGFVSPMGGAGLGFRYLRNRGRNSSERLGTIFATQLEAADIDSHLGVAGYARLGAIFFRDERVRPFVAGDCALAWFRGNRAQALVLVIGLAL
jgi:hypothetical protein